MTIPTIQFFSTIFNQPCTCAEDVERLLQQHGFSDAEDWFEQEDEGELIGRYQLLYAGLDWESLRYLGQADVYNITDISQGILRELIPEAPSEWEPQDLDQQVYITSSGYVFSKS